MNTQELKIEALVENLPAVLQFVDGLLESADCPIKAQLHIDLAVEEIFVNIASYAYAPGTGEARLRFAVEEEPAAIVLTFMDSGVPYNPLAQEDPDTTLSAEEREIGGLGIFMAKKNMDEVMYEHRDGMNILTLKKYL